MGGKKYVITGAAGFLGQMLARAILGHRHVREVVLVDVIEPNNPGDSRAKCIKADLLNCDLGEIITEDVNVIYHLAAIVSSHAQEDFDLGMSVNFDLTRRLLETIRQTNPAIRFIFSSSLAVFGGLLPAKVMQDQAATPTSSYGTQKAMCELLITDYSNKNYADGLVLRLPTISIRPGKPNKAASSFCSGIIREPLFGQESICPCDKDLKLWLCSPQTAIGHFMHAVKVPKHALDKHPVINVPGVSVSINEMLDALEAVAGKKARALVSFKKDPAIDSIVSSWPQNFDLTRAYSLGFRDDVPFKETVQNFFDTYVKG